MIISDLNYLELVAEGSSVVGGHHKDKHKKGNNKGNDKIQNVTQNNISILNQIAISTAVAIAQEGDAVAASNAENNAMVVQQNQNS